MSKKRKIVKTGLKKTKTIIISVLCTFLGVAALFSVGSFIKKDTKSIGASYFSVGGIDDSGEYVKQNHTLYTKDYVECQGLSIDPDYDSSAKYKVFLYNQNKELIETTELLSKSYNMGNSLVQYCRIMVVPDYEDDVDLDTVVLNILDISKIVNSLNISVNKNQDITWTDYFKESKDKANNGKVFSGNVGELEGIIDSDEDSSFVSINCESAKEFTVFASKGYINDVSAYYFVDSEGKIVVSESFDETETSFIISVPENAVKLYINYTVGNDLVVYRTR